MAASTASQPRKTRSIKGFAMLILEAARTFKGSFAKLNGPSHATSAHKGRVEDLDADAGSIPFGIFDKSGLAGNTVNTSPAGVDGDESEGIDQVVCIEGYVLEQVAVTAASAQTHVGETVYKTNNNDLTITRPTLGAPAGRIIRYYSATSFDVLMYSVETTDAIALGGNAQENVFLGTFNFADIADGDAITSLPLAYHGRFLALDAYVGAPLVGSGGTTLLNAEIGTTDLTGGVVTVSTTAGGTRGAKLAGTAITAANVFHEGDTLSLEFASTGGTRTSGTINVFAQVERLAGI